MTLRGQDLPGGRGVSLRIRLFRREVAKFCELTSWGRAAAQLAAQRRGGRPGGCAPPARRPARVDGRAWIAFPATGQSLYFPTLAALPFRGATGQYPSPAVLHLSRSTDQRLRTTRMSGRGAQGWVERGRARRMGWGEGRLGGRGGQSQPAAYHTVAGASTWVCWTYRGVGGCPPELDDDP